MVQYNDGTGDTLSYEKVDNKPCIQINESIKYLHIYYKVFGHRKRKGESDKANKFYESNGWSYRKQTTSGWDIEVDLRYNKNSWMALKELNKYKPLDMDEYVVENQIMDDALFDLWAHDLLKRFELLIGKAKNNVKCYSQFVFKYGIRTIRTFEEALILYDYNGKGL